MLFENIKSEERNKSNSGIVKVTTCGNILETMEMEKVNRKGSSIYNFGDGFYCNLSDIDLSTGEVHGEIKEFQRTENRGQNYYGMRKSMKAVRDIINCNVTVPKNARWLTLTYAENMTDNKRLCRDREVFWKRVIRYHKKHGLSVPEYISVVEPQGRGAWHLHELWVYPAEAPFLPNSDIYGLWGHGFVTVKKIDDIDNIGAYLTAYLCDIPLEEINFQNSISLPIKEVDIKQEDGTIITKKFIKGGRLYLYPNKMNFYRTSRGIKRPKVEWVSEEMAKEKVSAGTLTYSKTIRLIDNFGVDDFVNDIHYEYYNLVRVKNQEL